MAKKYRTYLLVMLLTVPLSCTGAFAADNQDSAFSSQWDSAISSLLLAAGMYGVDARGGHGANLSFSQSENLFKGSIADQSRIDGQNITLSYNGSAGKLGFSAGYIYTSIPENQEQGTLFLNLDSQPRTPFNEKPWFLALDMSRSFQVNETVNVGFGSKAMIMKNPFDGQDGRVLSMLLNLPMSYKNYFTITPELQWSRTLPDSTVGTSTARVSGDNSATEKDVFYGGMSISFSY